MKKIVFLFCFLLVSSWSFAASNNDWMPLLQADTRTASQTQQVLQWFLASKQPKIVFSTGASLVRIPPEPAQQSKLLSVLLKDNLFIKQVFAAVILTAMGAEYEQLSPLLQQATASEDHAVRSYAAAAYTILNPQRKDYLSEVVNLYIYDPAFAQRAMNLASDSEKQQFKYIKQAAQSSDEQVRAAAAAWLGNLQTKSAADYLLKMAKTETQEEVMTAIASALAKNRSWTLDKTVKGLKTNPAQAQSATYALALGFMTGHSVDTLKQKLADKNDFIRANAARSAAYMAAVLASPDAASYSTDKQFDISLLKGLIPLLTALEKQSNATVQPYAANALSQIAKLK